VLSVHQIGRSGRFAQHVQAGGVIHLTVDQDDAGESSIANPAVGLQCRRGLQLREDVGGGVHQHRREVIAASHGNRRLGPSLPLECPGAQSRTVGAVAIPLGESAPGGRPQYTNFHAASGRARHERAKRPDRF
jgi:hypothetical protein